jgi:5'-3' exonuclease
MGIPSYYKKLCDRIPGLLTKVRKGLRPSHLWIDFNCMIYHCLRRPGSQPFQGEETRIQWENQLIQSVCSYLKKIVKLVEPSEQVFVGVDGVVPMAKLRQQRLRRFKSHWTAAEERRIGKSGDGPRWDTNAITPGTAFMERLGKALHGVRSDSKLQWIISTAEEPGEGEHKAMHMLRQCKARKSHVVYGLDADLILLSLLQPVEEMWLFREAVECGEVQYTTADEEEYRYFSIHALKQSLTAGKDSGYLLDYCMAMSFVGNDFLPHGLSLKLKDGGHDILLEMLETIRGRIGPFIDEGTTTWRLEAVKACIEWLAEKEEGWITKHCAGKIGQRNQQARGTTPLEAAIDEWNKLPLRICDEMALVGFMKRNEQHKLNVVLSDSWQTIYTERYLGATTRTDIDRICREYVVGLDWILKYYMGHSVDREWCFSWFLPPLWSDLYRWIRTQSSVPKSEAPNDFQLQPQQQLALVLPLESWWLIRDPVLRKLPNQASQYWPSSFQLATAGKKQTWECEAQIPLLLPQRLRYYIGQSNRS